MTIKILVNARRSTCRGYSFPAQHEYSSLKGIRESLYKQEIERNLTCGQSPRRRCAFGPWKQCAKDQDY